MALIGYIRYGSSEDRKSQQIALGDYGCDRLYFDSLESLEQTQQLERALSDARSGDTFVVTQVDVIGQSLADLVEFIDRLETREIGFTSLSEDISTSPSGGSEAVKLLKAMAAFQHRLMSKTTRDGLASAKARGQRLGRPNALSDAEKLEAIAAVNEKGRDIKEVAQEYGVHPRTIKRLISGRLGGAGDAH